MNKNNIAIIGLGYVGLPLAVAFAKKGQTVVAYDISKERINQLKKGIDLTRETTPEELILPSLRFTSQESDLSKAAIYIITVPTPITETNRPDLKMVLSASQTVGRHLKKGDIVIYESTVYPGVTEEECVPVLERTSGLTYKNDFGVGYSPERINPGDKLHRLETIKKVVSGSDEKVLHIIDKLYSDIIDAGTFKCASIKVAEAAKVIENIQRDVNIALANELSIIFNKLGLNTYDVLDAAATKWNFARYEPGLVGGHCIGVDPYYLTHCAEKLGYNPEVILSGRRLNNSMGEYIAASVMKNMLGFSQNLTTPINVTILGFTFKENVPDTRNTKVIDIITELKNFGVNVQVYDPYADPIQVQHEYDFTLTPSSDSLTPSDAVIIAVKHKPFMEKGWPFIESLLKNKKGLVVDLKNSFPSLQSNNQIRIWRL